MPSKKQQTLPLSIDSLACTFLAAGPWSREGLIDRARRQARAEWCQSTGTWAMIRRARRARKPVVIIFPDGSVSREEEEGRRSVARTRGTVPYTAGFAPKREIDDDLAESVQRRVRGRPDVHGRAVDGRRAS